MLLSDASRLARTTSCGSPLQDIGKTLAQLNITVEAAVNAGLLGGLSASDVKIVAEAHRNEMDAARAGPPTGVAPGAADVAAAASPGPRGPGISASAPGSLGNPTPPLPASPAGSYGTAHGFGGGAGVGRARASSEDAFPLDLEDGEGGDGGGALRRRPVDEAALRAKADAAAQFDASQYGFFGGAGSPAAADDGLLLGELESDGARSTASGDAVSRAPSGGAGAVVGGCAGGASATAEEADADSFHLWNASLLAEDLEGRLNLAGGAQGGAAGGLQPGSAPASLAGPAAGHGHGGVATAAAAQTNLASLWGPAQVSTGGMGCCVVL